MKKILLSSVVAIAILTGCGDEKKVSETKPVEKKLQVIEDKDTTKTPEEKLVEQVKDSTSKVAQKIAEESGKVAQASSEAVKSISEKVSKTTQDVVETATETKDKIEQSINSVVAAKTEDGDADAGKGLYLKCAACHGQSAEKAALGKSQIIKGWEEAKIVEALEGYKTGSYGGVMKGVMKAQVATLSDDDIKALASYISSL